MGTGKVYLVGAGPGAPDLLTVRAVKVLSRAEIVFYDALINKEVLADCPLECTLVPVGTRCGLSTPRRQDNIHRLLAEAAQQYSTVVRLKGGDPCVFGRGGEDLGFYRTANPVGSRPWNQCWYWWPVTSRLASDASRPVLCRDLIDRQSAIR